MSYSKCSYEPAGRTAPQDIRPHRTYDPTGTHFNTDGRHAMRYQTAIFDLDGTLLNTLDDLHASTNHALRAQGFPPRSRDEVRQFVGNGIYNLIRLAVPEGSDARCIDATYDLFNEHYAAHHLDQTGPYPGITSVIDTIRSRGMSCCVVSNKGDYAVRPLVEHFFPGVFDVAVGEREGIRRKPAPDTVLACMDKLQSPPDRCVYIGDSEVDVACAANAGIDCIIVTWGFRDEDFLRTQGATTFAHTADELERLLCA